MPDAMSILLVAAGGAMGAGARYWLSGIVARRVGELFPWGTLVVNVSGALVIGVLAGAWLGGVQAGAADAAGAAEAAEAATALWLFAVVGVLGSYTTVSSFSLQTLALVRAGEPGRAALNVALSAGLCLGAAALGWGAATVLFGG